jgi:hypothetical protein
LPDSVFAPVVDKLSRLDLGLFKRRINYRDLSVRQLGSIYEGLLEYDAVQEDGEIKVRLQPFARKDSGSYYTPDELVRLIVDKTVGPLVAERWQVFGIASDLTASEFFKSVSTTGRLGHLYDFENRRPPKPHFFPAVDSRSSFAVSLLADASGDSKPRNALSSSATSGRSKAQSARSN